MNEFVRSSRCESSNCIEVSLGQDKVLVRNSERPGIVEEFTPQEWTEFIEGIVGGDLKLQ